MKNKILYLLSGIAAMALSQNIQANTIHVIPQPRYLEVEKGCYKVPKKIKLSMDCPQVLAEQLKEMGFKPTFTSRESADLRVDIIKDAPICYEGYNLSITLDGINITASQEVGAFWGFQSLRQMLIQKTKLPLVTLQDSPKLPYRGLHLDVSRHMFDVDFIKKYIDLMSLYKLNYFHWHLTDDQGWRIEIQKYPKLTTVAAFREETIINTKDKESDPVFDGKPYGGFYTQDQIRDIVDYAQKRHVTIIPEIDVPGHCLAVIAAYPQLACLENDYKVGTHWMISEDILCAGKDEVFSFLKDVFDEVCELFPGPFIHIGGDEVPKNRWQECLLCQKRISDEGLQDENQLQGYFLKRLETYLNSKRKTVIGWDEILEGDIEPKTWVMAWTARGQKAAKAIQKKHSVVMCPQKPLYFDHYQADKEFEPVAIGGFNSLEHIYNYDPYAFCQNEGEKEYIKGVQANLWTEFMPTSQQVEYMAFPRVCGLAEVAWNPGSKGNFEGFTMKLREQKKIFNFFKLNARVIE